MVRNGASDGRCDPFARRLESLAERSEELEDQNTWMSLRIPLRGSAARAVREAEAEARGVTLKGKVRAVDGAGNSRALPFSGKGEDEREGFVHSSHLCCTQMPLEVLESAHIERAQLLNHHPGLPAGDVYLGPEARRPHALGGGRNEHGRESKEFVRLDQDCITRSVLLMAAAPGKPYAVDITPRHSGHSAAIASMSAITRFRSARSTGSSASLATSAASPDRLRSRSAVSAIAWRAASARVSPRLRAMSSKARQPSVPRRSDRGWEAATTAL